MSKFVRYVVIPAVVLLALGLMFWLGSGYRFRSPLESRTPHASRARNDDAQSQPVLLAHVADPRIGAPPGAGGGTNERALAEALAGLRAGPGAPTPAALVITGDILPAEEAPAQNTSAANSAGAGGGTLQPPGGSGAQQQARVDTVRSDPSPEPNATGSSEEQPKGGETAQGQNPPRDAANGQRTEQDPPVQASPADAADSLGALLAGSPVAEVYLVPDAPLSRAAIDRVRARARPAGVRVYDLTSCYATGAETAESCRADLAATRYRLIALRSLAGLAQGDALAALARLDQLETEGRENGYLLLIAAPQEPTAGDTTGKLWHGLTGRPRSVATLTGSRSGAASAGAYRVRTAPLGNPRSGPAAASPTLSLVTVTGQRASHATLARPFQRIPGAGPLPAAPRSLPARLVALGDKLGEPARTAVFLIGVLVAFLTVAALWKVPQLVRAVQDGGAAADGANGQAGGAQNGATPTQTTVVQDAGGVFSTNIGRTVLSGLTGVAVVTLLKEIWGVSTAAGQGFFVIIFILSFFAFLIISAGARGWIDASTSIATRYQAPSVSGVRWAWWRQFTAWWRARKPARLVFWDSAINVLFGQGRTQSGFWEDRFKESQKAALDTAEAVRAEISLQVAGALAACGIPVEADSYRVNVSLLDEKESETFYIATDANASAKVFGKKTMAYVTAVIRQARWWRKAYMGGHTVLVSGAALGPARGLSPTARLIGLTWGGAVINPGPATFKVRRAGVELVAQVNVTPETCLCGFLNELNRHEAIGAAIEPAAVWMEAGGRLVMAAEMGAGRALEAELAFTGGVSVAFEAATLPDVELYANSGSGKLFPGEPDSMAVVNYFEHRNRDYEAFVLLPLPWPRRGRDPGLRRGVVHISFKHTHLIDALWTGLDQAVSVPATATTPAEWRLVPDYRARHLVMLEPPMLSSGAVRASLGQGTRVLGEVVQVVSDTWFHENGNARR